MIKKLHYIKEDYSGNIEKYCLASYKSLYPDFEFLAWKPGSSPLRILYDHGGLFIGPGLYAVNRIPDSYFEKDFLVFDNTFDSRSVNINNCCYSNEINSPLFLQFMQKGVGEVLKEKIGEVSFKPYLNESDIENEELNIFNKDLFGLIDKGNKTYKEISPYLVDMNTRKINGEWNLHYLVVDEETEANKVFSLCESFHNMKYEDGSKHFLLLVCNDFKRDLCSRMGEFLTYHIVGDGKGWNTIFVLKKKEIEGVVAEYISKFDRILSCEKLI